MSNDIKPLDGADRPIKTAPATYHYYVNGELYAVCFYNKKIEKEWNSFCFAVNVGRSPQDEPRPNLYDYYTFRSKHLTDDVLVLEELAEANGMFGIALFGFYKGEMYREDTVCLSHDQYMRELRQDLIQYFKDEVLKEAGH